MKVGSLFTGYGGLDMAVGGDLAWYSEIEPAACTVLAAHYPDVPNLGDIKAIDWSKVPPVDVLTGGYPCQPFSNAGNRKGKEDARHLWPYVRDAISALGPRLTILENVAGHRTLGFADVLADLADMGLSARWGTVRAADAGAPHSRARLFIVVSNPNSDGYGKQLHTRRVGSLASQDETQPQQRQRPRQITHTRSIKTVANTGHVNEQGRIGSVQGLGRRHHPRSDMFRMYEPRINLWESITGRPVPDPIDFAKAKTQRLNPVFVEWLMGLPEGHVTGHGLSAAQELKMLGNGVVPQQAALALRLLGVR
jgi:DNA (cytosine-5)-methyltransferase 1